MPAPRVFLVSVLLFVLLGAGGPLWVPGRCFWSVCVPSCWFSFVPAPAMQTNMSNFPAVDSGSTAIRAGMAYHSKQHPCYVTHRNLPIKCGYGGQGHFESSAKEAIGIFGSQNSEVMDACLTSPHLSPCPMAAGCE